jgi:hypothetical protein
MQQVHRRLPNYKHSSTRSKSNWVGGKGFRRISIRSDRVIRSGQEDRTGSTCQPHNANRRGRATAAAWENLNGSAGNGRRLFDG